MHDPTVVCNNKDTKLKETKWDDRNMRIEWTGNRNHLIFGCMSQVHQLSLTSPHWRALHGRWAGSNPTLAKQRAWPRACRPPWRKDPLYMWIYVPHFKLEDLPYDLTRIYIYIIYIYICVCIYIYPCMYICMYIYIYIYVYIYVDFNHPVVFNVCDMYPFSTWRFEIDKSQPVYTHMCIYIYISTHNRLQRLVTCTHDQPKK